MNMFKPVKAKTIEEYIDSVLDPKRKSDIIALYEFIKKTVPSKKPYMAYNMIGFGEFHYKSKSGREGDWPLIALASQKNYISVYVCASDGKEYIAEKFKKELPKASIGRSCIRFKRVSDIDLKIIEKILKQAEKSEYTF